MGSGTNRQCVTTDNSQSVSQSISKSFVSQSAMPPWNVAKKDE